MLVWDEIDVLTVLEVVPEQEVDGIWHKYTVEKGGIQLSITVYQYDGDVRFELINCHNQSTLFSMGLIDCEGVIRRMDSTGEYLEFAPAKSFGSRYDGISPIPYGVRVSVNPNINIALYG
ncbi:Ypar14, superfamily integron cassette [Vibrio neptunius]|uniref:Ypar14, super integron cassette n=1 Tax=Vibrio neptunius TaxID=170651 RepID=UPI00331491A2